MAFLPKTGRSRLSVTADLCYFLDFDCLHPSDHPVKLNEVSHSFPCFQRSFSPALSAREREKALLKLFVGSHGIAVKRGRMVLDMMNISLSSSSSDTSCRPVCYALQYDSPVLHFIDLQL